MDAEHAGAYWLLVSHCWRDVWLPDNDEALRVLARVPAERWALVWAHVKQCFRHVEEPGVGLVWRHKRLDEERDKQAAHRSEKQWSGHLGGVKSAEKRRQQSQAVPVFAASTVLQQTQPLPTTPSPSSTVPPLLATVDDLYGTEVRVARDEVLQFVAAWNELCGTLPRCQEVTPGRRDKIKTRLRERSLKTWRAVFQRMAASSFVCGREGGTWVANIDWAIHNTGNAVKVLEGKYDDRPAPGAALPFSPRTQHNADAAQRLIDRRNGGPA